MTDPLDVLLFGLPAHGGFQLAEWTQDDVPLARWIAVDETKWLRWLCQSDAAKRGDLSLTAVPYGDRGSRLMQVDGAALWVRTETGDSVKRLARFKPVPTIVLQEGTTKRMVAFWMLERGLSPENIERANRRLSYALNTKAGDCGPSFRFHPPGVILREGRSRPVVVHVAEQTDELYPVTITKRLKDRPKPDPSKWSKVAVPA